MSGSLIETLMDSEQQANRSCAIAALWVAAVMAAICLIGLTGALCISHEWIYLYAGTIILPILAVFAITMDRLCKSHLEALERQAKVNARLADVEKGLVLAAAAVREVQG